MNKRKPGPYDISRIYSEMELFLIASMGQEPEPPPAG